MAYETGMNEPRIENFEGIPFPLKEASLDEYVGALEPNHLARRELNELRKMALDGAKATAELLEALKKNRELENNNMELRSKLGISGVPMPTAPHIMTTESFDPPPPLPSKKLNEVTSTDSADYTRSLPTHLQPSHTHSPCPYCNNPVSVRPGPWAAHFARYHKDQARPEAPNV